MLLNRLPLLIALLLCAAMLGSTYYQIAPLLAEDTDLSSAVKQGINDKPLNTDKPRKNHNIASYQLFGDTKKVIEKPKAISKDLPKTKLKLTLTGVMSSGSEANASALIQGPDKETLNYRVDSELPGGAILKQVFPDRVVIERSGRLENLVFVEKRSIGIETYHPSEEEDEEQAETEVNANTPAVTSRTANPGRTQGIKDRLSKLRKRMLKNRNAL